MQTEIIEQIIHLPIYERIEIIEKVSRSVREELREKGAEEKELSIEERKEIVDSLRGIAHVEGKTPPTDEEIREDYTNYLSEKYK
jgi:hypothetical protein